MKIKFKKTTKLGYVYLFLMFPCSFIVANLGSDQENNLVYFLYIILWFSLLMAGYTGWSKECDKYDQKKDNESA